MGPRKGKVWSGYFTAHVNIFWSHFLMKNLSASFSRETLTTLEGLRSELPLHEKARRLSASGETWGHDWAKKVDVYGKVSA